MKRVPFALLTAALLTLFADLAAAQATPIICNLSSLNTIARAEGQTELVGDLLITCTGGATNVASNTAVPTVNLTVTLPQTITSAAVGGGGVSDVLLLIDDPGTAVNAVVPGFGNGAPPTVCATPLTGCAAFPNTVLTAAGPVAVMTGIPSPLGAPVANPPAGNVLPGVVAGNEVTFFGVPVVPPGTTAARTYRVTNVRINASAGAVGPVVASIAVTGAAAGLFSATQTQATVATVQGGLAIASTGLSFSNCNALNFAYAGNISFRESFASAFRTRVAATAAANSGQSNSIVQNVPGTFFAESGYEIGLPQGGIAGQAGFGTRLKAIFNNIPAGVRVFVSFTNVNGSSAASPGTAPTIFNTVAVGSSNTTSFAELLAGPENLADTTVFPAAVPTVSTANSGPSPAGMPYVELTVTGGSATAVWEVLNTNSAANETLTFAVWAIIPAGAPPSATNVNLSFAPNDGAAVGVVPGFINPNPASGSFGISACVAPAGNPVTTVSTGTLAMANPQAAAVDSAGNLLVADSFNNRIIRITPAGNATVIAGLGFPPGAGYSGDGGLAANAQLNTPLGVAVDSSGNIFIGDSNNSRIRKIGTNGIITTVAGNGTFGFSGDGGPATSAQLNRPSGVAVDAAGNLYIVDNSNSRIRMVNTSGVISTIAGTGVNGGAGDGGPAIAAQLFLPTSIAIDAAANLYVTDSGRVRKIVVGGNINTVAGGGCCNNLGDGGPATAATFNNPNGLALDPSGDIFIADTNNNRIRVVTAAGIINTVVGNGIPGNAPNQVNFPRGVAVDPHGILYILDSNNNRIQRLTLFEGSVSVSSAAGPPGSVVPVALTLNLNSGISLDSLGVTVQVSSGSGTLSFTPATGISGPISSTAVPGSIALAWNGNIGAAPVSGTVPLGTISVLIPANAPLGSQFNMAISQVSGDLTAANGTLTPVPLSAGAPAVLSVQNCSYLVGDGYPGNNPQINNSCGQFGDNQITFEDVIVILRVWGKAQGWAVPACTDLFDALDAFPPDNPPTVGGDGQITLADVQVVLNKWANLDPSRPRRASGSFFRFPACAGAPAPAISLQTAPRRSVRTPRPELPSAGAIQLGGAEVHGSQMRVPVYLRSSQDLTSVGISVGWAEPGPAKLRFFDGPAGKPGLLDTGLPGMVAAAWLHSLPATAGKPILLGYLEWDLAQGIAPGQLRIYNAEGTGAKQTPLRLEWQDASLQ